MRVLLMIIHGFVSYCSICVTEICFIVLMIIVTALVSSGMIAHSIRILFLHNATTLPRSKLHIPSTSIPTVLFHHMMQSNSP